MHATSREIKKRTLIWAIFVGFCLCLTQVSFSWIFSPKAPIPAQTYFRMIVLDGWDGSPGSNPVSTGYLRFNNWDSLRFFEISQNGYHIPDRPLIEDDIHHYRANVTTPPAYPAAVRLVREILKIPGQVALPVTAQLASWVFWIYFLLILTEAGIPQKTAFWGAITVAVHPGAFYMVMGYGESVFMAALLGFLYWTERWMKKSDPRHWVLAAFCGFVGTATRVAGIPIAIYPVFEALGKHRKKLVPSLFLMAFAAFGLISFLLYCQFKFGNWSLYFKMSGMVGQEGNYLAIFDPRSYIPRYFFEDTMWSINRTAVPWTIAVMVTSFRLDPDWRKRMGLYATGLGLFYVAMVGKATSGMDGMIRYTLPVFAILVLCLTQIWNERQPIKRIPLKWGLLIGFGGLFSLATQGWLAWRFLHGRWVS